MNYETASVFEINKAVAEALGNTVNKVTMSGGGCCYLLNDGITILPDYCNNPADAWPVIRSTPIDLACDDTFDPEYFDEESMWCAHNPKGNHWHHVNPLRAAMIVFLQMQESATE